MLGPMCCKFLSLPACNSPSVTAPVTAPQGWLLVSLDHPMVDPETMAGALVLLSYVLPSQLAPWSFPQFDAPPGRSPALVLQLQGAG